MSFSYIASIDIADARNNLSTIQLATSGKATISINLFSGVDSDVESPDSLARTTVFNHAERGLGAVVAEDRAASTPMSLTHSNTSLGDVTHNHLRDAATTAGWGVAAGDISFVYNETNAQYTLSYNTTFSVTFGTPETAALFGFTTLTLTGSSSYVSTVTPWGVIRPTLPAVSSPTTNYEPETIAAQAVSNSGAVSGISRSTSPIYRDWTQQYEPKEKTLRLSALSSHPFTHQELFEAVRTGLPFVVIDGGFNSEEDEVYNKEVFYLRAEGSFFKTERATDSNDAQFHIAYKTVVAGYIPPFEDS
jgi:hypothetical protein